MAHPHGIALTGLPHAVEQRGLFRHFKFGAAEFAMMAGLDLTAELRRHNLLAIANAKHGDLCIEDGLGRAGRTFIRHRAGTTGEDHSLGLEACKSALCRLERRDLAIDPRLAHAPGDELRHL